MPHVVRIKVKSIDFFMRNVRMRLPFRYGKACLVAAPLLHTRLEAEDDNGQRAVGACADILPPKWFDKGAASFLENIDDLLAVAALGAEAYQSAGGEPSDAFTLWQRAHDAAYKRCRAAGYNALTASFGSSIIERAVIDAACKLAGRSFAAMVQENRLGIAPERVHPQLEGVDPAQAFGAGPLDQLYVRHTVGLADPIWHSDLTGKATDAGIPRSVEGWIRQSGIRYFKIKLSGDYYNDLPRLQYIARLLAEEAPADYRVTLDGNEQFAQAGHVVHWFERMRPLESLAPIFDRLLFIEQPVERDNVLDTERGFGETPPAELPPLLIDEADGDLFSFRDAAKNGYRGASVKNCKGVFKGLLNNLLAAQLTRETGVEHFLSGEDLCNQPLLPLIQDLATLSVLRIPHAERNGHHYAGSLDHCSPREIEAALDLHAGMFEPYEKSARLRIVNGVIDLSTLQQPGYGTAIEPDWEHMTPLAEWRYQSLDIDDA